MKATDTLWLNNNPESHFTKKSLVLACCITFVLQGTRKNKTEKFPNTHVNLHSFIMDCLELGKGFIHTKIK